MNTLYATTIDSTYTYDDLSRLGSATNGAGAVSFTYDNRGRLKTETDVYGHLLEYAYDTAGNRTQLKLDSAVQTAYAYDAANRLTTLTDDASQNFTYGYDIANRLLSKALPNGVTTTYEYDGMSRLKRLKDANATATLFDRQYAYSDANQISQITEPAQARNFSYDNADRLTGMTNGTSSESYSYDAVGNRTSSHLSTTYTTGPFNSLSATAGATMSYDSNGSMTGKTVGSVNWTYGWDFENRMMSASDGVDAASYVYDALGRRVKRTKGTDISKFTHDGQDVVLDDENTVITTYQNGAGIDNTLSIKNGSNRSYVLGDHLGSTSGLADQSGAVTSSATYDSFGNQAGTLGTRYGYTGRERDDFTGLMYYRARMYDPQLGRFISEDPIGFEGGDVNLYGYVRNGPLAFRDPTGLQPDLSSSICVAGWGLVGAAAGFTAGGGVGAFAGPGGIVTIPAGAIYGAAGGAAAGAAFGPFVCGTPPFPNQAGEWSITNSPPPGQYCEPARKPAIPWVGPLPGSPAMPFTRSDPIPQPTPDREGCAEEISECVQLCARAEGDPDMRYIWGGSLKTCLKGCISERCQRGLRF
jgi:RHS repeat-associated protein